MIKGDFLSIKNHKKHWIMCITLRNHLRLCTQNKLKRFMLKCSKTFLLEGNVLNIYLHVSFTKQSMLTFLELCVKGNKHGRLKTSNDMINSKNNRHKC